MRRSLSISLMTALWLSAGASVQAQLPRSQPAPLQACLRMDAAMALAAARDPGVALAAARLDESEGALSEARALRRPRLDAIARGGVGETGVQTAGASTSLGLRASQRVLDFGDSRLARAAATADIEAGREDVESARDQAARAAGSAFIDWVEAGQQIALTEDRVTYFRELLDATDAALSFGGATRTERASVAAQLAEAEGIALELRFQRDSAQTRLDLLTGTGLPACSNAASSLASAEGLVSSATLEADALAHSPQLRALDARARSLDAQAERQARARLPIVDVVATGSYASFDNFSNFDFQERVGINVSVPLYAGNALSARTRQAKARVRAAEAQHRDAERGLRQSVRLSSRRLASLRDRVAHLDEVAQQTRLEFDAAEIQSEAGTLTLRDVVEIRVQLEQAELAVIAARRDMDREALNLALLTGRAGGA